MLSLTDPTNCASTAVDLEISGRLPLGLSGRLVGVGGGGGVHSLRLHGGRVSYVADRIGTPPTVEDIVAFEGAILVHGDDSSIRQLSAATGNVRRVDVAGHGRTVVSCPKFDPTRGELHLVARDWDDCHVHVVVPAGALTRRSRSIVGAPARIERLAVGRDHVVFLADGVAGISPRDGEGATAWADTGVAAPHPVGTYRDGNTVVLVGLTPILERWTIHPASSTTHREVLGSTPQRLVRINHHVREARPVLWTIGDRTAHAYDLATGDQVQRSFGDCRPGDLAFVADPARPHDADGGWLVGFVHGPSGHDAELVVLDAADIARPTVAGARIPRPVPADIRTAWIPDASRQPPQGVTP